VKKIDIAYQTMFSELEQRCLDAEFDETFPETGQFKLTTTKGRDYWYLQEKIDDRYRKRYVGPASDPEVARRVENFKAIKDGYRARRRMYCPVRVRRWPYPRSCGNPGIPVAAVEYWPGGGRDQLPEDDQANHVRSCQIRSAASPRS
jgi:hypothetical protein